MIYTLNKTNTILLETITKNEYNMDSDFEDIYQIVMLNDNGEYSDKGYITIDKEEMKIVIKDDLIDSFEEIKTRLFTILSDSYYKSSLFLFLDFKDVEIPVISKCGNYKFEMNSTIQDYFGYNEIKQPYKVSINAYESRS